MMKLAFLLAFFFTGLTSVDQNPINGEWKGSRDSPNGVFEISYTFQVEGNVLTGTSKTSFGETKVENGKVDGKKFSYSVTFNDMTINNTGELVNDNEIIVKNDWGELTLKRVK